MIATDLAQGRFVKLKHYLAQFRSSRIPGRKALAVNFTQRLDKSVAVLAADFAILVAMTMVETRFAHAASRAGTNRLQTVPESPQQQ